MRSIVTCLAAAATLTASASAADASATTHVVKLGDRLTAVGQATAGKSASYKVVLTKPNGDSFASYKLTYGDGTKAVKGKHLAGRVSHTFAKPGKYSITLVVTDAKGKSATTTLKVIVIPVVPATVIGTNLLQNGDAEASPGSLDDSAINAPVDWITTGQFTAVSYAADGGFPDATNAGPINGGSNFFAGGNPDTGVSTASQTVDVSASAAKIDAGSAASTLSGDLGGFSSQGDNMVVTATFRNGAGSALSTFAIGPVTPAQRNQTTGFLAQSATVAVPVGTRSIQVVMTSTRTDGIYDDGYADNVGLTLG